jgi:hypothetical protein
MNTKTKAKAKTKKTPLAKMIDQLGDCLNVESAKRILEMRADAESQKQIDEWADKCTEGELTKEEHKEYGEVVRLGTYIAMLKIKARQLLAKEAR